MKRPVGYAILAVLVGIMSLSEAFGFFSFPKSTGQFRIVIPPLFYVLLMVQACLGAVAAWSLWMYRRNAPEVFLVWVLLGLVSSFYSTRVIMPQMVRAVTTGMPPGMKPPDFPASMIFNQIAFDVLLSAAAYWYLTARRRPRIVASSQTTPVELPV